MTPEERRHLEEMAENILDGSPDHMLARVAGGLLDAKAEGYEEAALWVKQSAEQCRLKRNGKQLTDNERLAVVYALASAANQLRALKDSLVETVSS